MARRAFSALVFAVLFTVASGMDARAQRTIRDAEIEATLQSYAVPLFKAAGLNPKNVRIHIVQNPVINAYVTGGQQVFLNTGLLIAADNPGQIIGVIAHEIGHIRGGHLSRLKKGFDAANKTTLLTLLLGGAVAAASGSLDPLVAGTVAGSSIGQRTLLAYTRGMENAADQSGLELLDRTRQSAHGMLEFLILLQKKENLISAASTDYARSHPLTSLRIEGVRHHIENSRFSDVPPSPEAVVGFMRMRGKLKGFLNTPDDTLQEYSADSPDIEARYARALAFAGKQDIESAEKVLAGLLEEAPKDAYLHELRGDILARGGRIDSAITAYERAVALAPNAILIRLSLAKLLLDKDNRKATEQARRNVRVVLLHEREIPSIWRWLATAEGRLGCRGAASLALAEEAYLVGNAPVALRHAAAAMRAIAEGSPGWLRAEDITNAIKGSENKEPERSGSEDAQSSDTSQPIDEAGVCSST